MQLKHVYTPQKPFLQLYQKSQREVMSQSQKTGREGGTNQWLSGNRIWQTLKPQVGQNLRQKKIPARQEMSEMGMLGAIR